MRPELTARDRALIKWQQLRERPGLHPALGPGPAGLGARQAARAPRATETPRPTRRTSSTTRRSRRRSAAPCRSTGCTAGTARSCCSAPRSTAAGRCPGAAGSTASASTSSRTTTGRAGRRATRVVRGAGRPRLDGARAERARAGRPDAGLHRRGRARRGRRPDAPLRDRRRVSTMPEPTVLTVILNYRTPAMTLEAVEAALREMADIAGEIVVVDNNSGDGSFETISAAVAAAGWDGTRPRGRRRPQRRLRRRQQRRHPRRAERRRPPGLCLHPELRRLPGRRRDPRGWSTTSRATPTSASPAATSTAPTASRTPPPSASRRSGASSKAPRGSARSRGCSRATSSPLPIPEARRPVDWLAGASVMMRRTMLDAIGLFDERLLPLLRRDRPLPPRPDRRLADRLRARERGHPHRLGQHRHEGLDAHADLLVQFAPALLRQAPRSRLRRRGDGRARRRRPRSGASGWSLQGLPPGDPPHFLRDLVVHAFRACKPRARRLPTERRRSATVRRLTGPPAVHPENSMSTFTCIVIGNESLVIQCADMLLAARPRDRRAWSPATRRSAPGPKARGLRVEIPGAGPRRPARRR